MRGAFSCSTLVRTENHTKTRKKREKSTQIPMYRARSVGFLRLILEKYQPTAQPLIPIDSKLQIAYYTVSRESLKY